jgi:hypothetical protein
LWYLSLTNVVLIGLASIIWHFNTFQLHRSNLASLQKILSVLPYLKFFISLFILWYVTASKEDNKEDDSLIKVYLETIITTIESIFKTIFWFLFILISCGWQIYRYNLNRSEMRKFIGVYIFIYLSVCFDQILDLILYKPLIYKVKSI